MPRDNEAKRRNSQARRPRRRTGEENEETPESVTVYIKEMGQAPLLTPEEERELALDMETSRLLRDRISNMTRETGQEPSARQIALRTLRSLRGGLPRLPDHTPGNRLGGIRDPGGRRVRQQIDFRIPEAWNSCHATPDWRKPTPSAGDPDLPGLPDHTPGNRLGGIRGPGGRRVRTQHGTVAGPALLRHPTAGDLARERLIIANIRLVISVAKRHLGYGIPLTDLAQEGVLGLMHAVSKFEHRRGNKFGTYATWWIRQAIGRAVVKQGRTIRLPVHRLELIRKVEWTKRRIVQETGDEPTLEELAEEIGLTPDRVKEIQRISLSHHVPGPRTGRRRGQFKSHHSRPHPRPRRGGRANRARKGPGHTQGTNGENPRPTRRTGGQGDQNPVRHTPKATPCPWSRPAK